ncbi:MAG: hypothetical protein ACTJLM_02330 [Ehrlichia sp.]
MTSVYFVINLAFYSGALLAFRPLCKKVKQILATRVTKIKQEVTLPLETLNQSKELLNSVAVQRHETEEIISEILKKAYEQYDSIITENKKRC